MPTKPTKLTNSMRFVRAFGTRFLLWLGSNWMRGILIALALLGLGYGIYTRIWLPLVKPVDLPRGVTPTNPALDVTMLKDINTQRARRIQAEDRNLNTYNRFFVPPREIR